VVLIIGWSFDKRWTDGAVGKGSAVIHRPCLGEALSKTHAASTTSPTTATTPSAFEFPTPVELLILASIQPGDTNCFTKQCSWNLRRFEREICSSRWIFLEEGQERGSNSRLDQLKSEIVKILADSKQSQDLSSYARFTSKG
jgi:hypothetical protein